MASSSACLAFLLFRGVDVRVRFGGGDGVAGGAGPRVLDRVRRPPPNELSTPNDFRSSSPSTRARSKLDRRFDDDFFGGELGY